MLRTLEERDIRFVRLWFTDVLGTLKSIAVAPAELEGAFADGIGFDGSAIEGFARVYEADMILRPDPATFQLLPWRGEYPGVARMFCDILMPGINGLEVVKLATAADGDLAIVMLTAVNDASSARTALQSGALEYLLKPMELDDLGVDEI